VDYEEFCRMADAFIASGLNYFDTAHGYIGGQSETAIRDCVAKRYDRSRFLLTDKLTDPYFKRQEDIRPFFENQLRWCGVEYFDFYLMHAQDRNNYQKYKRCKAYETCYAWKQEGLIRHFGISFHDKAEVLDMILNEHPEIEVVQIQFNYVDYEDASVESKKVYEVCEKHGKPVIVMEPVKGGSLVNLPQKALDLMTDTPASYAIRFAADPEGMMMVLSGMSNQEQMEDNLRFMENFQHLSAEELALIDKVRTIYQGQHRIPCTACRYCEAGCPAGIPIPDLFTAFNEYKKEQQGDLSILARAAECLECGKCEGVCPQHLHIRELLKDLANVK